MKLAKGVAEEIETLLGELGQAGFTFVDLKSQPPHQSPHFAQGCFTLPTATANDEIIGIINDVGIQTSVQPELGPCQQKPPEVQVGQ